METIRSEAYFNSNAISDIDNFRGRNLETDYEKGLSVIYPSCEIYAYEQNLFRLIAESTAYNFKPRWTMRPDYTSFDIYGTTIHWTLILFINDVYSIEDYRGLDKVLVPPASLITEVIRERVPRTQIDHLDKFVQIPGISMFQRQPMDIIEKNRIKAKESLENAVGAQMENDSTSDVIVEPSLVEVTEQFILSAADVTNKYVDLYGTPVNYSSILLYVGNFSIPQKYGYDYVLTYNSSNQLKRISWDPIKCFSGKSNLNNLLKENVTIKIKFLQLES